MSSSQHSRSVTQKAKGPATKASSSTATTKQRHKSKQQQHNVAEYYSSMSYPMLTTGEIVDCLLELGVEGVTEDEIKDPPRHKDRMKQIYMRIVSSKRSSKKDASPGFKFDSLTLFSCHCPSFFVCSSGTARA
jgi:Nuf2 family